MSEQDHTRAIDRRTVVKTVGGAGAAGLLVTPAAARETEEYPRGPLADVPPSERLTFEELRQVLQSDNNGAVRLVDGDADDIVRYVGDNRDLTATEIEREFDDVSTDASVTWNLGCIDAPYVGEICSKLELTVYTFGVGFDLVVLGYPVVGAELGYKDGFLTFKFNVPKLPVKGELAIGATDVTTCSATLEATLTFRVYTKELPPLTASREVSRC